MSKPIFTSLAPNTEWDDVWLAARLLYQPWKWRRGEAVATLEAQFRTWLPVKHAYAFSSGRAALHAILETLSLRPDDEVLLQAYTCVAVPDPILWASAKPVYVDCAENTFKMSPVDLERKITVKSRVLIIQHTFGLPADMDALLAIAKKHNLFVIEDCAHALGAEYNGKRVGTFGDAAFFSFGRDKVISSVFGGMVVTVDDTIARRLKDWQATLPPARLWWIFQQLNHPVVTVKVKLLYRTGIGQLIMALSKLLHITSKAVHAIEKRGGKPAFTKYCMPEALAVLALHQFKKMEHFNMHRRTIAHFYSKKVVGHSSFRLPELQEGHIYLRYTIQTQHAAKILAEARKRDIFLGDWYRTPIAPNGVDYDAIGYKIGSCPNAEKLADESINLPTDIHISPKEADRVVNFIKNFA